MANKKTGSRYNLGEPHNSMLSAFCEAQDGTPEIRVIRKAVEHYILHRTTEEKALGDRYRAALEGLTRAHGGNVVPLKKNGE